MSEMNREKLSRFLTSVDQEIELIKVGESKFRPRGPGMYFGPEEKSGLLTRLKIFKNSPTRSNLAAFLTIAAQDLGTQIGEVFTTWSQGIFPPTTVETAQKKVKPYSEVIKDGFYDMFRAAQIGMSQKQVEQIETASLRLAQAFEDRIQQGIKEQLDHLVSVLNAQKEKEKSLDEAPVSKPVNTVESITADIKVEGPKPKILFTEESDTNV